MKSSGSGKLRTVLFRIAKIIGYLVLMASTMVLWYSIDMYMTTGNTVWVTDFLSAPPGAQLIFMVVIGAIGLWSLSILTFLAIHRIVGWLYDKLVDL